jgi:hypothetical protein
VVANPPLSRRTRVWLGPGVTFAQLGVFGFNGQIGFEAPRPYGPPAMGRHVTSGM